MYKRRDEILEQRLQNALDSGSSVWVVGDIHGYLAAFRNLLEALSLAPGDHVVCLGDLIDRGEDSAGVVELVRSGENIHSVMGNHEWFAIQAIPENNSMYAYRTWELNGGYRTWISYGLNSGATSMMLTATQKQLSGIKEDVSWMRKLPIEVVLDHWRIVHAGYNPHVSEKRQSVEDPDTGMLWIRQMFYQHHKPFDPARCVLFGHTVTGMLTGAIPGNIAAGRVILKDGRPAWMGLDTGMFNGHLNRLAAFNLRDQSVVYADSEHVRQELDSYVF